MKHLFFALAILFCLATPAAAMNAQQGEYSSAPYKPRFTREVASIEVLKKDRLMVLFDAEGKVITSYKISLGRFPEGHKEQEGDGRTPEGKYTIDMRNGNSHYYRSLRISYPSAQDVKAAKKKGVNPGGNIFIHGKPNMKFWMFWKYNKSKDWTDGCIAVDDRDMRELWEVIHQGTPITINP
jgi:murein L,D-transpeptidase YafK